MHRLQTTVLTVLLLSPMAAGSPAGEVQVLGDRTPYRYFLVGKPEQVRLSGGGVSEVAAGYNSSYKLVPTCPPRQSESPPADWMQKDFDDSSWPQATGALNTGRDRGFSLVCTRWHFRVDDPARAGELALSLKYRGGVVVYLNGREIGRGHMPKGKISPDTPARDYPKKAYVDTDGNLLRLGFKDPETYPDRFALRTRGHKLTIAGKDLVKGVNVLAVSAHRPLTDEIFVTGKPRKFTRRYCEWETLALKDVTLTAPGPLAAAGRPGLMLWNALTTQTLYADQPGNRHAALKPLTLHGCRNGTFSGVVMAGSVGPLRKLSARITGLQGKQGTIPAKAVELRYGIPRDLNNRRIRPWFDNLDSSPPAVVKPVKGTASVPVWLTVRVPAKAAPGEYRGTLSVRAEGQPEQKVEVRLRVADWRLPPVTESSSWWWMLQSPDSLSMAYNAGMWSPDHLKLLGESFDLLRDVGTRIIYVPLFRESVLGNPQSMIRWIKKADGAWKCDFENFEKYIDTAIKHLGKLEVVCVHSWPRTSGGSYFGKGSGGKALPFRYTLLEPGTGKTTPAEGPSWNDGKEIRAFLKPAFDGIRERLLKRGISKDALMVGICHDVVPSKECVAALKEVSGAAKWVAHCHPSKWSVGGEPTGYLAYVWGTPAPTWPDEKRRYGWQEKRLCAVFPRHGSGTSGYLGKRIDDSSPPAQYRVSLEAAILAGVRGYGWVGSDFWPVAKDKRGRLSPIVDRYPYDGRSNLSPSVSVYHLLGRGARGPLPTVRHQMIRAGLQETEARIYIEKILNNPAARARLGGDLVRRCRKLLKGRQISIKWARRNWAMLPCAQWDAAAGRLFELAAEVASKAKS